MLIVYLRPDTRAQISLPFLGRVALRSWPWEEKVPGVSFLKSERRNLSSLIVTLVKNVE